MVYQGSKNKLAKHIIPIIQDAIDSSKSDTYIELFVGGANIIDKIQCKNRIGADLNENLIKLLKYAQEDPDISIAPAECSFEHYADVRRNQHTGKYSKEYVALIGYMASYGGRYFDGGYGRDQKGGRCIYSERLSNFKNQAKSLSGIDFFCMNYVDLDISKFKNAVFYLDPPYKGTKQYKNQQIDYEQFYEFCKKIKRAGNKVLVSEYWMPEEFECIWQKERKVLQKSNRLSGEVATEKLFVFKGD